MKLSEFMKYEDFIGEHAEATIVLEERVQVLEQELNKQGQRVNELINFITQHLVPYVKGNPNSGYRVTMTQPDVQAKVLTETPKVEVSPWLEELMQKTFKG